MKKNFIPEKRCGDNITLKHITELEVVCMKLATRGEQTIREIQRATVLRWEYGKRCGKQNTATSAVSPKTRLLPFPSGGKADAWRDLERGWNISAGYCRGEKSRQRERATVGRKLIRRGSTPAVHVKPKTSLFELWPVRDHISNSRTYAMLRKKKIVLHWLLAGHIQIFMKMEQGKIGSNLPVLLVNAFIKSQLKVSCSGWFGSVTKGLISEPAATASLSLFWATVETEILSYTTLWLITAQDKTPPVIYRAYNHIENKKKHDFFFF